MADPARARKVADRIKEVIAANLGQVVKDPDLGFVTITEVRVTNDLQHASVFYTVFGDEDQRERSAGVLAAHKGRLRSLVGRQLGIRLTPTLELVPDAVPENAAHIDELLRTARQRDAELAADAADASYAGEADPYRVEPGNADVAEGSDDAAGRSSER
jgi:ribosome-binding factor A